MLLAPVMTDARYHYMNAIGDRWNIFQILNWAFVDDVPWRLRSGRFAPVGSLVQRIFYDAGARLSMATGLETYQAEAVIKVLLIASLIGFFAWLMRLIRTRSGHPLSSLTRWRAVVLFAVILCLGVQATDPVRNGWTAFVVLCIGGVSLLLLSGVAGVTALTAWPRASRGRRILIGFLLALLGAATVLSYEAHWAAAPFFVILVLFVGRPADLIDAGWRDRTRWAVVASYVAGFVPALIATRILIAVYAVPDAYAGLTSNPGGPVIGTSGWQVASALPGAGIEGVQAAAAQAQVQAFSPGSSWWVAALVIVALAACWWAPVPGSTPTTSREARALVPLALAALASLVAVAFVLSVSVQAQQMITGPDRPYRGTPWIWTCLAIIITVVGVYVLRRRAGAAIVFAAVAVAIVAQVWWVRPANLTATEVVRADPAYALYEEVGRAVVLGPEGVDEATRCDLARRADTPLGNYGRVLRARFFGAYTIEWGAPMCPDRPVWRNP
ncbi:hypothetical protein [Janibacter sp. GXQ6167]|uniref:hypothetical protein n=1 Tax=Janibacter sp. GXQ6167 TaxID=3240791 RepID=UPI00352427FD